jgi:hypothetical protein
MCCKWWAALVADGDPNQPVILDAAGIEYIGAVDEPVHFCPWCGASKDPAPFDLELEPPAIERDEPTRDLSRDAIRRAMRAWRAERHDEKEQ